ncbi:Maf family protein [Aurantiacibacter gangjinensis]|uniref:Nucleoside triphosphate pyrophosphatase n=1 Tax=Aurantiacibacter gangjinensis TaxID=502682 RepID=A0A0G9MLE8_9SPHN|nr:Maf family protein [Aurantiacibacter gangjinensis]APE27511.1 Septum formation protein Maf [Aurantiacibacter gangjinensis]KLE31566.1 septum formation protein Maf [Aurantiacibacter gangjinensis]
MIVLASKSASRRAMLEAAGVAFEAQAANVDERAIEAGMEGARPDQVALALAEAKALAIPADERLVLGSDSLVVVENRRFDKPENREEAAEHLRFFSGKAMQLHSAAALARGGEIVWRHPAVAMLFTRELSEDFITAYLDAEWPAVAGCVGVFRIEAMGVQLFERIEGDQFTVLGMPLLPVLGALRDHGELPS